jgi:hypothetical protein
VPEADVQLTIMIIKLGNEKYEFFCFT